MPKYIKIKEPYENTIKIMKVHHEEQDCYVCEYKYSDILLSASKDWVIAQSDNLAELCDMTIVVDDEIPTDVFELEWCLDEELLRKYNDVKGVYVYGAIWTSKGLIYVAKLNDDGKLELL